MKVYISADLEGIGGVLTKDQVTMGNAKYSEACRLLGMETYSLIEGLVKAGVSEIVVYDAHGTGINIPYEYMHKKAKYVMGYSHPSVRFPFLDSTFDFIILQGYHAMAGTEGAILDHTYSSAHTFNLFLNDERVGEVFIDALVASELGVPVALVTGDDKTVKEAKKFIPLVDTYETKKSIARHCALVTPPEVVRRDIEALAGKIVANKEKYKSLTLPEIIEVKHEAAYTSDLDSVLMNNTDIIRADGRTVIKKGKRVWETIIK